MDKNILYTSGQQVELSNGDSYTVKDNEVYVNKQFFKKEDLEVSFVGLCENMQSLDVKVGLRIRLGNLTQPANNLSYPNWTIDDVEQTSLSGLVEALKTALYYTDDASSISVDISSIESVIQNLNRTPSTSQKIFKLDSTNTSINIPSGTISYIDVICIGNGSTGKLSISPVGTIPLNEIDIDYNLLYKYNRVFDSFENKLNQDDLSVLFNGTGGYIIVEIGQV